MRDVERIIELIENARYKQVAVVSYGGTFQSTSFEWVKTENAAELQSIINEIRKQRTQSLTITDNYPAGWRELILSDEEERAIHEEMIVRMIEKKEFPPELVNAIKKLEATE